MGFSVMGAIGVDDEIDTYNYDHHLDKFDRSRPNMSQRHQYGGECI